MNETTNEVIVDKTHFPTPTGRLQELITKYRSQTGIVEPYSKRTMMSSIKVRNDCKTRSFEDLTETERETVIGRIANVDYLDSVKIQTFGSAKESPLTKLSEKIITQYKASDLEELSAPITELVAILKSNSPRKIIKDIEKKDFSKKEGFFSEFKKISFLERAKKEMHQQLAEHQNILKNINEIVKVLKKEQVRLYSDITIYQEMTRSTFTQISDFELDRIALQLLEDDAQEKLSNLLDSSKGELDLIEASKVTELNDALDRLKRKSYKIQSVRTSTIQCLPQLAAIVYGDEILCEKIDEIENLLKPLWEWQYAIAIGALHQKQVIEINRKVKGFTSSLLRQNAESMHDNMIATQQELHEATVAIEDLAVVQEYIDDMVTTINTIRQEAREKSIEALNKMQEIEAKNINLMKASLTTATDF